MSDQNPKKYTSKFFRVATEGATTDGRHIQREWIEQMAASYNPSTYGARVWIEHIRGISPDSSFRAYGDVVALEAREVEDSKLALFAKIDPTPELVELTKKRQKIYTSIEINPKFANTESAYLVGLGVTDSPASLGTQVLEFAQQNPQSSPFSARKQDADNLFSESLEASIDFQEDESPSSGLLERVRAALKKFSSTQNAAATADREEIGTAMEEFAESFSQLHKSFGDLSGEVEKLTGLVGACQKDLASLTERVDTTPNNHTQRPPATGGNGHVLTDV